MRLLITFIIVFSILFLLTYYELSSPHRTVDFGSLALFVISPIIVVICLYLLLKALIDKQ